MLQLFVCNTVQERDNGYRFVTDKCCGKSENYVHITINPSYSIGNGARYSHICN